MILNTYKEFKDFFNKTDNTIKSLALTLEELSVFILYLVNGASKLNPHQHKEQSCKSPKTKYVLSYTRNYIIYINNAVLSLKIDIPVVKCDNCEHYHSILPGMLFVPYRQYSLSFILMVLNDRHTNKMKVEAILEKYNISKSTYYSWLKEYQKYYRIFITMKQSKDNSLFKALHNNAVRLLEDFYLITGTTVLSSDCNLYSPSG